MSVFRDSLRPASFRGVEFYVITSEGLAGRRVHMHEYPFRDDPWAEDLGRRARQINVKGFLVGDDVADQLDAFNSAAEEEGSGELVHPLRGTMTVTLLALTSSDAWDEGRVVKLELQFVETGERLFPGALFDGGGQVASAASAAEAATGAAAQGGILSTLRSGASTVTSAISGVQGIVRTAQSYVGSALRVVSSATGALRSVASLAGIAGLGGLGRFLGQATKLTRLTGVTSLLSGVTSAVSRFNSARNGVVKLGSGLMSLVNRL